MSHVGIYPYCSVCGGLGTHPDWCPSKTRQAATAPAAALESASHGSTEERVGAVALDFRRTTCPAVLAGVQQHLEEAKARQNCIVPVDVQVLSDMLAELLYYRSFT